MLSLFGMLLPNIPKSEIIDTKSGGIVEFKTVEKNKTEVIINHLDWLNGEQWKGVLDWLEKSCEN